MLALIGSRRRKTYFVPENCPPGFHFDEPGLGRIIVIPEKRVIIGSELIRTGIQFCQNTYPNIGISIEAQHHLKSYYEQFGFNALGDIYEVDNPTHKDETMSMITS